MYGSCPECGAKYGTMDGINYFDACDHVRDALVTTPEEIKSVIDDAEEFAGAFVKSPAVRCSEPIDVDCNIYPKGVGTNPCAEISLPDVKDSMVHIEKVRERQDPDSTSFFNSLTTSLAKENPKGFMDAIRKDIAGEL
jgi:hypothetical protein